MIRTLSVLSVILTISAQAFSSAAINGDAGRGERLFTDFRCIKCYSVGGKGGTSAPPLAPRPGGPFTPVGMAGAMWSHAAKMWQAVDKAGVKVPAFSEQQAADLYAFVAQGKAPVDSVGDAARGRGLYQAKLCASCHDESMLGAPRLSGQAELKEIGFGILEGKNLFQFDEELKSEWNRFKDDRFSYRIPGAENYADVANRLKPFKEKVLHQHEGEEILIVGHRVVNRLLIGMFLDIPLEKTLKIEQTNDCLYLIERNREIKIFHYLDGVAREGLLLVGKEIIL